MPKYVVFSFDDGRLDTFTNAFPILSKYGFAATVNITTDFINNPHTYTNFKSAGNMAMTWDQILALKENGWEIASHAHTHTNDSEDIKKSLEELEKHGIPTENIGFASPNSEMDKNRYLTVKGKLPAEISYVRSGLQIRREGLLYTGLTFLNRYLNSKKLFCLLNQRCKLKLQAELTEAPILSVGVSSDMSVENVVSLLKTLFENECYILMFHSVLLEKEDSRKVDAWWWGVEKFERLCRWLVDQKDVRVISTKQLVKLSLQMK